MSLSNIIQWQGNIITAKISFDFAVTILENISLLPLLNV
jgi:hypothetical protein